MSLKKKLMFLFLGVGILPFLAIGIFSYHQSSKALEKGALNKLSAVKSVKGMAVKRYFESIRDQILTFSDDIMIQDAMREFRDSFYNFSSENDFGSKDLRMHEQKLRSFYVDEFGAKFKRENGKDVDIDSLVNPLPENEKHLQYYYIGDNPHPLGSKEELNRASDKSTYSKIHSKYHPPVRNFLRKFGYYDIFLVDIKTGNIVYSVFKELDFATSLLTGPYSNTNFAEVFKKASKINDKGSFAFVDYKKYVPSYEAPASFIASPIWDNGKKIGVLIFQMPIDRINAIMLERSGMGKTGETYIFGEDRLMRSDSYLDPDNFGVVSSFKNPEKGTIKSTAVSAVLNGQDSTSIGTNYLGHTVLTSFSSIDILGMKWGLISEISKDEAFASISGLKTFLITFGLITVFVVAGISIVFSGTLANKISEISSMLLDSSRKVAHSSEGISVSSVELSEAATEQAASLQETVASVDEISSMVQRNADGASESANVSAKSTQAANRGKDTVRSMIKSMNDIAASNDEIASEMKKNTDDIVKIVNVISQIGEKTQVINDIVFQTKLLSFNASVEAARAGEHGKGFAVVAEEVGNLASMSGKAALEITGMLDSSISEVTKIVETTKKKMEVLTSSSQSKIDQGTKTAKECEEALDEILTNVNSANAMVKEIATASDEQSTGIQEITRAMQQLDQATHQNSMVAQESSEMSITLKSQADRLNDLVHDLMEIISGTSDFSEEKMTLPKMKNNVFHIRKEKKSDKPKSVNSSEEKKEAPKVEEVPVAMASGGDSFPDESDPRFEEL